MKKSELCNIPVFESIKKEDCCGCEACSNICPISIITLEMDEEGYYYPTCNNSKCIHCNLCVKTCPVLKENYSEIKGCFAGYALDSNIVSNSSSGGFFSLIVNNYLEKYQDKFFVSAVVWNQGFKGTHHICSNKFDDMMKMRQSKYVQSRKNHVYAEIKKLLSEDNMVLFVGCPCEVAGLNSFLGKTYNNLLCIDLVCQGPTSEGVMTQYIDRIKKKNKGLNITSINMRYVHDKTWIPQWIKIDTNKKKNIVFERFYDTDIGRAVHILQRESCYQCKFNGKSRYSDLTLGDFHGADSEREYYNPNGTSIIVANTEKGYEVVKEISSKAILEKVSYSEIERYNPRLSSPMIRDEHRKQFSEDLKKYGLHYAAIKSWPIKVQIRQLTPGIIRTIYRNIKSLMGREKK